MDVHVIHPITHDGIHYGRGLYEGMDDELGAILTGIHTDRCTAKGGPKGEDGKPVCRNHSAVEYVQRVPVMGKATVAADVKAAQDEKAADDARAARRKAPPEANVEEPKPPVSDGPGKATRAVDAPQAATAKK